MRAPDLLLPLLFVAVPVQACAPHPPPTPASELPPLPEATSDASFTPVDPHWDQPCLDARGPVAFRLEEVVDTAGLTGRLDEAHVPASEAGRRPRVDVALIYGRSGAVRSVHLQSYTVDRSSAKSVEAGVAEAVRPLPRLLEPAFFRIRLEPPPRRRIRLLPALRCMPHIDHEGLAPERIGAARAEVGRLSHDTPGEKSIGVRLHISAEGGLTWIEMRAGDPALLERVRRDLADVPFSPALMNGQPVRGELPLVLRYPARRRHRSQRCLRPGPTASHRPTPTGSEKTGRPWIPCTVGRIDSTICSSVDSAVL